jgi:hypothetical protein
VAHRRSRPQKRAAKQTPRRTVSQAPTSARQRAARDRALHALALMRRGESLAVACRLEHIKPSTFLRYVGSAVRQDKPGGRFRALASDRLRRDDLQVPTAEGYVSVSVRGIKTARLLSDYLNAIGHFSRTGDESKLRFFRGKTFTTLDGQRLPFLTDPNTLMTLAEADALRLDSLYASVTSRP